MAIAAVRTGEALSEEFEELYSQHWQLVYRTAYAITGNRQDAEDVLQSIFVKLLQRRSALELTQPRLDRHLPSPTHMGLAVSGERVLDDLHSQLPSTELGGWNCSWGLMEKSDVSSDRNGRL
jgi:hypothetical protein